MEFPLYLVCGDQWWTRLVLILNPIPRIVRSPVTCVCSDQIWSVVFLGNTKGDLSWGLAKSHVLSPQIPIWDLQGVYKFWKKTRNLEKKKFNIILNIRIKLSLWNKFFFTCWYMKLLVDTDWHSTLRAFEYVKHISKCTSRSTKIFSCRAIAGWF